MVSKVTICHESGKFSSSDLYEIVCSFPFGKNVTLLYFIPVQFSVAKIWNGLLSKKVQFLISPSL